MKFGLNGFYKHAKVGDAFTKLQLELGVGIYP
jgi:hypothetical protein